MTSLKIKAVETLGSFSIRPRQTHLSLHSKRREGERSGQRENAKYFKLLNSILYARVEHNSRVLLALPGENIVGNSNSPLKSVRHRAEL